VQSGGSWKKVVIGPTGYVTEYTYSYATPSANTQATMGTVINTEMAARVADCVYYNPLQTFTSPELDRLPVGGSGIAGAFGNLTMLNPVLHETSFVNLTNSYTTSTSPQVDTFLFGVVNNGGDYSYCALGSGLGTTGVASNIPVKQDLTQIVKAYADNIANFQSFAFAFVASGFSVNPTQAIGPDFMVDFLWKTYSNNVTWSGGFITGGEVRAKRLTYGGASLANCHVSLSPAAFELPAGCRVN
jgi:hypothetical protein